MNHLKYLSRSLSLAAKAQFATSPNPMVGALVVKHNKVIATGYHQKAGQAHAELIALKKAGKQALGATLYVSLEPCCHVKKLTPPCVVEIIKAGIKEVFVGLKDPNPQVSGLGIKILKQAGIKVTLCQDAKLEQQFLALNYFYHHWIIKKTPYVILKSAMSLDEKIASGRGVKGPWISANAARAHAHQLRAQVDAILVGINTVIVDDPQLTARIGRAKLALKQPRVIILDPSLRIPETAQVVRAGTIIVTQKINLSSAKACRLRKKSVSLLSLNLRDLLKFLGEQKIISLLVEGGAYTISEFIKQKLWQELQIYLAPKNIGAEGLDAFNLSSKQLAALKSLPIATREQLGKDLFFKIISQ